MQEPSQRWQQVEALFHEASELGPAERQAFLDNRCSEDAELRLESESLLVSADALMDFLQRVIAEGAEQVVANPEREALQPCTQFAGYEIVSRLVVRPWPSLRCSHRSSAGRHSSSGINQHKHTLQNVRVTLPTEGPFSS